MGGLLKIRRKVSTLSKDIVKGFFLPCFHKELVKRNLIVFKQKPRKDRVKPRHI